ncbi:Mitosis inhibitor protein kinase wee1 [Pseudoloma neurophilia]|uniref:Mitosis inhibitor protein kinase wee1 n=1 Tax=Pseudoloma neurophilia TaxID=146866 RepID=A0A0R0M0B4_9MICR|nr:Mitosis inhibitor protein kinase wee1 [Pseudoloma neurophilia]
MLPSFPLKRNSLPFDNLKAPNTPRRHSLNKSVNCGFNVLYGNPDGLLYFSPIKKLAEGDFFNVYEICRHTNQKINLDKNMNDILRKSSEIDCLNENSSDKRYCNSHTHFALKISKTPVSQNMLKEIEILKNLIGQPGILQLRSSWIYNDRLYIETVHCNFGSLGDLIEFVYIKKKKMFSDKLISKIMINILNALDALEKYGIIHGDIAPANIFLTNQSQSNKIQNQIQENNSLDSDLASDDLLKYQNFQSDKTTKLKIILGDFNISRYINDEMIYEGTPRYLAPEVLDGHSDFSSDFFSLVLVWLELTEGIILPSNGPDWHNLRNGKITTQNMNKRERNFLLKVLSSRDCFSKEEFRKILLEASKK